MDKETIKKLAKNPSFIPGIYNYCDRWCERCPFTSRCMTADMERQDNAGPALYDLQNQAFWDHLHETFKVTLELLRETAEQKGIDLNSLKAKYLTEKRSAIKERAKSHPCARAALTYSRAVSRWFDSAGDLFHEKEDELNKQAHMGIPDPDPQTEASVLNDNLEIIRWYQHLIYAKIMRALDGEIKRQPKVLRGLLRDSDGSAKVVLIAMDRSIAAWAELRQQFPQREDDILTLLVQLERLRRGTEKAFPNARAFVRPGFDE